MLLLLHSRVVRRRLCHDVWRGWVVPRLLRGIGELHGGALLLRVTVATVMLLRVTVLLLRIAVWGASMMRR